MPAVFCRIFGAALAIGTLLVSNPALAKPLPISKLTGKWCGTETNYIFAPKSLTVVWTDDGQSRRFAITRIIPSEDFFDVHWIRDGKTQNTVFSKFSADGRRMFQLANTSGDMGPERPFQRCK